MATKEKDKKAAEAAKAADPKKAAPAVEAKKEPDTKALADTLDSMCKAAGIVAEDGKPYQSKGMEHAQLLKIIKKESAHLVEDDKANLSKKALETLELLGYGVWNVKKAKEAAKISAPKKTSGKGYDEDGFRVGTFNQRMWLALKKGAKLDDLKEINPKRVAFLKWIQNPLGTKGVVESRSAVVEQDQKTGVYKIKSYVRKDGTKIAL